jgi:hypothetical protein
MALVVTSDQHNDYFDKIWILMVLVIPKSRIYLISQS